MTPSCDLARSLNIMSRASARLEMRPVLVLDCSCIRLWNFPPSFVMLSIAFCTSGKPILPSVTICEISARVLPSCVANSPARSMPRLWNCITSRVYKRPCTAVVPYNHVRSCRFSPRPAATLPSRVSVLVISAAANPYARSWRAPLATPCRSNGVLAASSTICDINASAFSLLWSRVAKATSSC